MGGPCAYCFAIVRNHSKPPKPRSFGGSNQPCSDPARTSGHAARFASIATEAAHYGLVGSRDLQVRQINSAATVIFVNQEYLKPLSFFGV